MLLVGAAVYILFSNNENVHKVAEKNKTAVSLMDSVIQYN